MVDMNNDSSPPLCGTELVTFQKVYAQNIHGYASLLICVMGSMANLMNIVVLTRKDMISPTNVVLTGLAIADLAVLLEYIPYTMHTYLRPTTHSVKDRYTYGWAMLVLWHSNFSQVFHTISIWLTVVLAVWRYIAVAYPQKNRDWCNMDTTYVAVVAGYILCPLLCIPVFLSFNVMPVVELLDDNGFQTKNHTIGTNTTVYVVTMSEIVKQNFIKDLNFLIYSVLFKLTPSVALTVLSLRLVCALLETKKRRQKLTSSLNRKNAKNAEKEKQTDRTTRMLLAVLILFLVTEVPQGILGLLTVIFGEKFFKDCYQKLGEVADVLALINSAINFALYYVMSRQFRTTFKALLSYNTFPARKHTPFNDINNHTTTQITQV